VGRSGWAAVVIPIQFPIFDAGLKKPLALNKDVALADGLLKPQTLDDIENAQ
jgi:hypothetical protein